jgi:large subunit ribosomal protein L3
MIKEIYGKKIGMTQVFDEEGNLIATTLIEVDPVYALEKIVYPTKSKLKIGCFKIHEKKVKRVKKPIKGYFDKLGISPYKLIREVDIEEGANLSFEAPSQTPPKEQGEEALQVDPRQIGVNIFNVGNIVDVRTLTKGKGFAGGMKRHHWSGQPKTHGSTSHRRIGSAGTSAYPSRIIKGLHMPGHMGNKFRTAKNLEVLKVDTEKNLLFVKGNIGGSRGAVVRIKKVK